MATISTIKEQEILQTPLLVFECRLPDGTIERWSTHDVTVDGASYAGRVLAHNVFESRALADEGIDAIVRISLTLANTDSHFSQIERATGWKGAKLTVRFVFYDLKAGAAASESAVVFQGVANAPAEIREGSCRLSFTNRLSLRRMLLPEVRIQRRCPWIFPATAAQRQEAVDGGAKGRYSPFYRCGYSPDQPGGAGNVNAGAPFTSCDYTRQACEQRGMFNQDAGGQATRRFGGIEFVPASVLVRSYGEPGYHVSEPVENRARYNDFVPLVYGTAWYEPPIVFARNDGNLTRMEVLLGRGEIEGVRKVVVNGVEIPEGQAGKDMTATGWFNVVSAGGRTGAFNPNFTDGQGNPAGDPYGSMAYLSVVVPNRVSEGRSLPRIEVLVDGMKLDTYDSAGAYLSTQFTNNPAWVLLDLLQRCGWAADELDLASFAAAAAHCGELIPATDFNGNPVQIPRYQCNVVVRRRRSAADLVRGVRNAAGLYLTYGTGGKLRLHVESTLAVEQPQKPEGSNATAALNGGWPAYEFGDGSLGFGGLLRKPDGEPAIRVWARETADTPNRYSVEFQDAFNQYQQDSLSIADVDDVLRTGQEVSARLAALGLPNFHQAARIIRRHLDKGIRGNLFVQFETSVRGVYLKPGDLITLTYQKEGWQRQPFRVIKVAAGENYSTVAVTCQIHDDAWYSDSVDGAGGSAGRRPRGEVGLPRPLPGKYLDAEGRPQFEIAEETVQRTDGSVAVSLSAAFNPPATPGPTAPGIPIVGLTPTVDTTRGSLAGGETYYYAVSAVDSQGTEGELSFIVRAAVPAGSAANTVILNDLSFPAAATSFHVYRGTNPQQLFRIASNVAVASQFEDGGMAAAAQGPPDANYDHARFYWRLEKIPETAATIYAANTIGSSALQMIANEHVGAVVRITGGAGAGQERAVIGNDAQTLTVSPDWSVTPDATSLFAVAEGGWRFGAAGKTSPVEFEIPNRQGATVQVTGRAVNPHGREAAPELSPVTRWTIGGGPGGALDLDVPPAPVFGLSLNGQGTVALVGLGFSDFTNTRSIEAGTLTIHYWNELSSPTAYSLGAALAATDTIVELNTPGPASVGTLLQIGSEVLVVDNVLDGGLRYEVTRGSHGTTAAAQAAGTPVYHLDRNVFVIPFVKDFFGSPASGSFSYPIFLPDVRIAAAELFMTNSRGNSESTRNAFTANTDEGLRTLSGGQLSIQVEGPLAVESNAAPPLVIEEAHAVRDVFAVVQEAPTEAPVDLELLQDGVTYCTLTIPAGQRTSNVVDGFGLPPLQEKSELTLRIVSVGQTSTATPGRDLTVIIRL